MELVIYWSETRSLFTDPPRANLRHGEQRRLTSQSTAVASGFCDSQSSSSNSTHLIAPNCGGEALGSTKGLRPRRKETPSATCPLDGVTNAFQRRH